MANEGLSAGQIVQVDPDKNEWGPALVVITEVRTWGVIGYTDVPRSGRAFIRLPNGCFEATGGRIVWDIDES